MFYFGAMHGYGEVAWLVNKYSSPGKRDVKVNEREEEKFSFPISVNRSIFYHTSGRGFIIHTHASSAVRLPVIVSHILIHRLLLIHNGQCLHIIILLSYIIQVWYENNNKVVGGAAKTTKTHPTTTPTKIVHPMNNK